MKKLCFCLISLVALLFVGFSTYYILRNDENISYSVADHDILYMNVGESISSPVLHERKAKGSNVEITFSNDIVEYNQEKDSFVAKTAGSTTVTCIPSNSKFASITFTIRVGNGTEKSPFYIRTEQDVLNIGSEKFLLSSCYEIVSDIEFSQPFSAIGSEENPFEGTLFGGEIMYCLSNIDIQGQGATAGIFAKVASCATIERVVFKDVKISGEFDYAGVIAGINQGTIKQCKIENASVENTSETGLTGLVAGENAGQNARISLVSCNGKIISNNIAGGICGSNRGSVIDNSFSTANVELKSDQDMFGGLVGQNSFLSSKIDDKTIYYNAKFINDLTVVENKSTVGQFFNIIAKTVAEKGQSSSQTYFNMIFSRDGAGFKAPIGENIFDSNVIEDGAIATNYYKNLSPSQVQNKKTFTPFAENVSPNSTWDFETFWSLENGKIDINFANCAGEEPAIPWAASGKINLESEAEIQDALHLMELYPDARLEYTITKKMLIDMSGQQANVIGNEKNPFTGKFVAEKGLTIKGLTIANPNNSKYVGLFGVVSGGDTLVKGITLDSVSVEGETVGAIAGFNDGAKIEGCKVSNSNINSSETAGSLVGLNAGELIGNGLDINSSKNTIVVDDTRTSDQLSLGGAVGINQNKVTGIVCFGDNIKIATPTEKTLYLGGVVGNQMAGLTENCESNNIAIDGASYVTTGFNYAGGIAGYVDGGDIRNCLISSLKCLLYQRNENSFAGGVAGYLNANSVLCLNHFYGANVSANLVGGIVANAAGKVERCAADIGAELIGDTVGGIVGKLSGSLLNSYSLATLNGSNIEAGFVGVLVSGSENNKSQINYCYNYCSYIGGGEGYCETSTPFRSKTGHWTVSNNIVVGEKVGKDLLLFKDAFITRCTQRESSKQLVIQNNNYNKGFFKIISEKEAKLSSQFGAFVESGFDSSIWEINSLSLDAENEVDSYLTLIDLPVTKDA